MPRKPFPPAPADGAAPASAFTLGEAAVVCRLPWEGTTSILPPVPREAGLGVLGIPRDGVLGFEPGGAGGPGVMEPGVPALTGWGARSGDRGLVG